MTNCSLLKFNEYVNDLEQEEILLSTIGEALEDFEGDDVSRLVVILSIFFEARGSLSVSS